MTHTEMVKWLQVRYSQQCEDFPTLREIPERQYIAANLPHMQQSMYWKTRLDTPQH